MHPIFIWYTNARLRLEFVYQIKIGCSCFIYHTNISLEFTKKTVQAEQEIKAIFRTFSPFLPPCPRFPFSPSHPYELNKRNLRVYFSIHALTITHAPNFSSTLICRHDIFRMSYKCFIIMAVVLIFSSMEILHVIQLVWEIPSTSLKQRNK